MPVRFPGLEESSAPPARRGGIRFNLDDTPQTPVAEDEGGGGGGLLALLGGAGLLAAGVASRKPGLIKKGLSGLGNIRQQLMLSGLAIPKAVVSNIGGATIASAERRSLKPLTELLSPKTAREIVRQYKIGAPGHVQAAGTATGKAMHGPGRVLGAIDEATQQAFHRAGISPEDALDLTFQRPLGARYGPIGETLDSPAARYLIPFRRTPFNVFAQGFEQLKPENLADPVRKGLLAASLAAGGAHGAATAEDQYPVSMGIGAAAANRYALPYLLAAAAGRHMAGGRDPKAVAGEALPISEYGLTAGVTDPLGPFTDPAFLRALERLSGSR